MEKLRELNLNSLRIAESAARNGSFVRAAEEQLITPSAVSQRMKMLEAQLRFRLFDRRNNSVALTPEGETFIRQVREGLDTILAARQAVNDPNRDHTLKVRALPTFTMRWLLRRLPEFQRKFPALTLSISTSYAMPEFGKEDLDLAICYGDGAFGDLRSRLLFRENLTPVCSPDLLARNGIEAGSMTIKDLERFTLLHSATCTMNWRSWLDFSGEQGVIDAAHGMHFDSCMLTFEAANAGLGFAAANRAYVLPDIVAGRLVAPFDHTHSNRNGWYITSPRHRPCSRNAEHFEAWIANQAEQSEVELAVAFKAARPKSAT